MILTVDIGNSNIVLAVSGVMPSFSKQRSGRISPKPPMNTASI